METIATRVPETCAHCGEWLPRPMTRVGRTRVYCSDRCRKAAWDARCRPGSDAASVVVVERVVVQEHDLSECSRRASESPVACRNVLRALQGLAEAGHLASDPRWERAFKAYLSLRDALQPKPKGWRR